MSRTKRRKSNLPSTGQPTRAVLSILVYAWMGAIGAAWWSLAQDKPPWWLIAGQSVSSVQHVTTHVLLASGVALPTVLLSRWLDRNTGWASRMGDRLRAVLCPMTHLEIFTFAITSSIGEELFFRGALMGATGLLPSSLVFGLVHVPSSRAMWVWPVWATVMGVAFGSLVYATGDLVAPIAAHFLINFINLHMLNRTGNPSE